MSGQVSASQVWGAVYAAVFVADLERTLVPMLKREHVLDGIARLCDAPYSPPNPRALIDGALAAVSTEAAILVADAAVARLRAAEGIEVVP